MTATLASSGIEPAVAMLPRYDLAKELLIPGLSVATSLRGMFGYFTSGVLVDLAPGLAEYIARSDTEPVRFVVSPELLDQDYQAVKEGTATESAVLERRLIDLLGSAAVTESALAQHTLACLAWLISSARLEFKVAFPLYRYHPKVWLLSDPSGTVCARGSANATGAALRGNIEHVDVDCSWLSPSDMRVLPLVEEFETQWHDESELMRVYPLATAVRNEWLSLYSPSQPPTPRDYAAALEHDRPRRHTVARHARRRPPFSIPRWLRYRDGPFAHQGDAVDAWCNAGYRGVLEMATGSGKTITAMICAHRLYREQQPLLIVIAAPYVPLVEQWRDEVGAFGPRAENLTTCSGPKQRARVLRDLKRKLEVGGRTVAVVVVSHDTLCTPAFRDALGAFRCRTLLIADEVHNLGRPSFLEAMPDRFEYRLGLSATPVRQYDESGTGTLLDFFGSIVFCFPLDEAIGRCLVEYDYHVHPVHLDREEMNAWRELTGEIKANAWRTDEGKPDDYLSKLFRDRRLLLETAERKIATLGRLLDREDLRALRHTLVYASDKAPDQLQRVNGLLSERNLMYHQLTAVETRSRNDTSRILKSFQDGDLQVLTAKRVLDEGVNVPQVFRAFILASTTVERQWIQRRGRLLRKCSATGKTHSVIHDLVTLPPSSQGVSDRDSQGLVKSELRRVRAFAKLARNAGRADGPLAVLDDMVDTAYG